MNVLFWSLTVLMLVVIAMVACYPLLSVSSMYKNQPESFDSQHSSHVKNPSRLKRYVSPVLLCLMLVLMTLGLYIILTASARHQHHTVHDAWQAQTNYHELALALLQNKRQQPDEAFYLGLDEAEDADAELKRRTDWLITVMLQQVHANAYDADLWDSMAHTYALLDDASSAQASLARAYVIGPDNMPLALRYAKSLLVANGFVHTPRTRKVLARILKQQPHHEWAQMLMGMGEIKAGNLAQASYWLEQLKKSIEKKYDVQSGNTSDALPTPQRETMQMALSRLNQLSRMLEQQRTQTKSVNNKQYSTER